MTQEDPEEKLRTLIRQEIGAPDPAAEAQKQRRTSMIRLIIFVAIAVVALALLVHGFGTSGAALFE